MTSASVFRHTVGVLRAALAFVLVVAAIGCGDTCTDATCPSGTYCSSGECRSDCVVASDCEAFACDGAFECCSAQRHCDEYGRCVAEKIPPEECYGESTFPTDGWDDPIGTGHVFVVSALSFASRTTGTNLDGRCGDDVCVDNAFAPFGFVYNDALRQYTLGGDGLFVVEIAGVVPRFLGYDRSVTVKIYPVRDADDPFFPANNFSVPPGATECCQFRALGARLDGTGQPTARIPARIDNYRIVPTEPVEARIIPSRCEPPPIVLDLARATFTGMLEPSLSTLRLGVLSGVWRIADLRRGQNPFCDAEFGTSGCPDPDNSSLLTMVRATGVLEPDIDLDGDGRECFYDTDGDQQIDLCCDGIANTLCPVGSRSCTANAILPTDPEVPSTCALSPRAQDGFSVAFAIDGVAAQIVAIE